MIQRSQELKAKDVLRIRQLLVKSLASREEQKIQSTSKLNNVDFLDEMDQEQAYDQEHDR